MTRTAVAFSACSLVLAAFALSGCYTYQPVRLADVPENVEVRARISAQEAERVSDVIGRSDRLVEGTVVENGSGALLVEVPVVSGIERRGETLSQRVRLVESEILEVELKELDQLRTGSLLGIVAAGGLYLLISELTGGPGSGPPDLPPPTEMRIPIGFKVPWG